MRGRRQAPDARGILRVVGVEPEFQNAVLAAHLLIIPVVIAVAELREVRDGLGLVLFSVEVEYPLEDSEEAAPVYNNGTSTADARSFADLIDD
jgi:hypothetical protein